MVSPSKLKRVADALPGYPGDQHVKRVVRPLVEHVGGKWIRREAERQVVRLVGFHVMWHELRRQGAKTPAQEMVRRGIMASRTAYDCLRDFELVFGVDVDEASAEDVLRAAVGVLPVEATASKRGPRPASAGGGAARRATQPARTPHH